MKELTGKFKYALGELVLYDTGRFTTNQTVWAVHSYEYTANGWSYTLVSTGQNHIYYRNVSEENLSAYSVDSNREPIDKPIQPI